MTRKPELVLLSEKSDHHHTFSLGYHNSGIILTVFTHAAFFLVRNSLGLRHEINSYQQPHSNYALPTYTELLHEISNKMTNGSSENSDQPRHLINFWFCKVAVHITTRWLEFCLMTQNQSWPLKIKVVWDQIKYIGLVTWKPDFVACEQHMSLDMRFPTMWLLTSVDSNKPVQLPFKLRNSKWCLVSSLMVMEYLID